MRHKHADLIIAWANGAVIETLSLNGQYWYECPEPSWSNKFQYRIKPEPKPDVVKYCYLDKSYGYEDPRAVANVKVTFCGDTGKLKSAEVQP